MTELKEIATELSYLKGNELKIMLVLSSAEAGLTLEALAQRSLIHDLKTLTKACQALAKDGGMLVVHRGAHGKQTWRLVGKLKMVRDRLFWTAQIREKPGAEIIQSSSETGKPPIWTAETAQIGENPATAGSLLLKIESSKSEIISSDSREQENRTMLKNASLLFGKPVNWQASFAEKSAEEILGWLAQAWQACKRGKSDRPWGLAYRGLSGDLSQKQPDKHYLDNPYEYLPQDYLQACGLAAYVSQARGRQRPKSGTMYPSSGTMYPKSGTMLARPTNPREELVVEYDEKEDEPEAPHPALIKDGRIVNAWQAVKDDLTATASRAFYLNWVIDTLPVAWDAATGLLSVGVKNEQTVEMLADRLASTAQRQLCGILNQEVRVRFVVI
jgi:hypothetical protein